MNAVNLTGRAGEFAVACQLNALSHQAGLVLLRDFADCLGVAASRGGDYGQTAFSDARGG
jgi:hypothetical protein